MKQSKLKYERGAALLLIAAGLVIATSVVSYNLLSNYNQRAKIQKIVEARAALDNAKSSLLAYAASIPEIYSIDGYPDVNSNVDPNVKGPGFFPCPDMHKMTDPAYGTSSGTVGCAGTTVGRLPSALSKDPTHDNRYFYFADKEGNGGPSIWYAVDTAYRATNLTNADTTNMQTLAAPTMRLNLDDGMPIPISTPIVAVLIYANEAFSPPDNILRDTSATASAQVRAYLERENADGDNVYSLVDDNLADGLPFNDVAVGITYDEWKKAIYCRVYDSAKANNWCAVPPAANTWFARHNWKGIVCNVAVLQQPPLADRAICPSP
jgi:hypothetical protein